MSDIKCPVCGEKIEHIEDGWCNCKKRCIGSGSIDLWLNFIRTRKALDLAIGALNKIKALDNNGNYDIEDYDCQVARITQEAIEQINEIKGGKDE